MEAINDGQLSELSPVKFIRAHREINARVRGPKRASKRR